MGSPISKCEQGDLPELLAASGRTRRRTRGPAGIPTQRRRRPLPTGRPCGGADLVQVLSAPRSVGVSVTRPAPWRQCIGIRSRVRGRRQHNPMLASDMPVAALVFRSELDSRLETYSYCRRGRSSPCHRYRDRAREPVPMSHVLDEVIITCTRNRHCRPPCIAAGNHAFANSREGRWQSRAP